MESRWSEVEAARFRGDLGQRVYSSRLLGSEPSLVLHGGGNTSVKLRQHSLFGPEESVLYVKASGFNLATIESEGFVALRMEQLLALSRLERLSDVEMAKGLRAAAIDPDAPAPSVEAILHAVLPYRYVDHAHPDVVLALTNTPSCEKHVREAYGELVVVVPYAMPGFELARLCTQLVPAQMTDMTVGLVLLNHGIFSFGESARESYERMIALVTRAEDYLSAHGVRDVRDVPTAGRPDADGQLGLELARLRSRISAVAGHPVVLHRDSDPLSLSFARRSDVATLSQRGPATPDHALFTKPLPLLGRDVDAYAASYREYFDAHTRGRENGQTPDMLDPAPRVVLDPELGLCTIGRNAQEAEAAAEIYRHTIEVILRADALERWEPLSLEEVFSVEYWPLEQAKLQRWEPRAEFAGEVAVVTGAASGIGSACVKALLERGASVCGLDTNSGVLKAFATPSFLGLTCDVRRQKDVTFALESCAGQFGGIDMLVLSAGIFPPSRRIDTLDLSEWRRVFAVNADADLLVMALTQPFLELAPKGGRVVVIASKNVAAPGPGAAAYSASKAALTQLARVAALEWGYAGIRVNVIHPDAVFDTGIWNEEVIRTRAAQYGITPEQYRTRNILRVEVTSRDVAQLAASMCGAAFAKTTGAQVPVDGGNERVI